MKSLLPTLSSRARIGAAALLLSFVHADLHAAAPLEPGAPILLPNTHGKFDFLRIDASRRRLLAAHPGHASLDIFDLDQQTLLASVATGAAQSCTCDENAPLYYVGVSTPPQLAIVDAEKFEVLSKVALSGPADIVAFNPQTSRIYVCHDDAKEVWVVDALTRKIEATVKLETDSPEDLAFDPSFHRLYLNLKTAGSVVVIDPETNKVIHTWSTAPAKAPHGMAMLPDAPAFLVAGGNGKLVMLSREDGRVLASADIAEKVDQIAYDAELHTVYCASSAGKISAVKVDNNTLKSLGDAHSAEGTHSIAVDPKTHHVWIAYAQGGNAYLQSFTPAK